MEKVLPQQVGGYRWLMDVEPLPPVRLELAGPSKQSNYSDEVQVVYLIAAQMESLEEAHSLVSQVDAEVEMAGAKGLERSWRLSASPEGAWKMSRLAFDKHYIRFYIPAWAIRPMA